MVLGADTLPLLGSGPACRFVGPAQLQVSFTLYACWLSAAAQTDGEHVHLAHAAGGGSYTTLEHFSARLHTHECMCPQVTLGSEATIMPTLTSAPNFIALAPGALGSASGGLLTCLPMVIRAGLSSVLI